ncbi:hypothetical protein GGI21_003269, partial [Coemansia aciculifera]
MGGQKSAVENPWAVRSSQRQAAAAEAEAAAVAVTRTTKAVTRPTAAMLNGRRHPQAMDPSLPLTPAQLAGYDDDAEGKQHWDEMLDKGFDFSQDIEFGDGTAVRINSRTRAKLPSMLPTAANITVEPQATPPPPPPPVFDANDSVGKDLVPLPAASASIEPPASSLVTTEIPPPTPHRVAETTWGKPAKPAAEVPADGTAEPASARWWKASLSGGGTTRPQPVTTQAVGGRSNASSNVALATGRGNAPIRAELSDGNSSSSQAATRGGRSDRGSRPARGSRRNLAPIPTVVPPVLLRRPTQTLPLSATATLEELCPEPTPVTPVVASATAVVESSVLPPIETLTLTDSADSSTKPTPLPAKAAVTKQKPLLAGSAEAGLSAPRNLKKPSGVSNSVDNWRTGTAAAPKPPALQPTSANAQVEDVTAKIAASSPAASGPVDAASGSTSAARRRSTGATRAVGSGPLPGSAPRSAIIQQDKSDRITNAGKLSVAATATSWRADPNRAKPAAEALVPAPVLGESLDASSAIGRQRAQTQGAYPGTTAGGEQGSQLDGGLHASPQTTLSPPPPSSQLLSQAKQAGVIGEREGSTHSKQSGGISTTGPIQSRSGVPPPPVPSSSASLFNVEGSPLMGSNSSYSAPVRPVFGHADPGLYTWQGGHMGFNAAPEPSGSSYSIGGNTLATATAASLAREIPARWSNAGDFSQQHQQQVPPPPPGVSSAMSFSSFASGPGMLWMDPNHVAYDSEGRLFRAPIESRPSSHGESASGSGSASGAGSNSSGPRGYKAPGRTPRPIGTRSSPANNAQRNTRSRQGGVTPHQPQQQQPYAHGAPSPVGGQHPLFVPASHMHQSWLPHYSLIPTSQQRQSPQMTSPPLPAPV